MRLPRKLKKLAKKRYNELMIMHGHKPVKKLIAYDYDGEGCMVAIKKEYLKSR